MPVNAALSAIIILAVALTTFGTRVFPFLLFPEGKVLTPAVIGMLVVYCLKNTSVFVSPHGIPEFLAVAVTAGLHVWKRNNLLSIGVGTALYMFLIQVVF